MAKYQYTGKEGQNLAGIGNINPGDIVTLTTAQALGVERHAPEQFKLVDDATPATANKAAEISAKK